MSNNASLAIPLTAIAEGKMHSCTIAGREIVLCRTKDGIFALDNICSHAYARLSEGRLRGTRLICPLHGAAFDIRSGAVLGAPATRPLSSHPVRIDGPNAVICVAGGEPNPA